MPFHNITVFPLNNSCTTGEKYILFFLLWEIFVSNTVHFNRVSIWFFTPSLIFAQYKTLYYFKWREREWDWGLKWHAVLQTNKGATTEMKPQVVFRGYHLMELFPHWLQVQGRDKDSQSPETQTANVA